MAFVFFVILCSISSTLILRVLGSISAKIGFAPSYKRGKFVAVQVKTGVITSSSLVIFERIYERCSESVPLPVAREI